MRAIATLACCSLFGAAPALDLGLRLAYERYGEDYTITVDGPLGSSDDDRSWDDSDGWLFGVTGDLSLARVSLLGIYRDRSEDAGAVDVDYTSWGGRLEGGIDLPLLPKLLHLEFMAFVGIDQGELEYSTPVGSDDAKDTAYEYGAHIDAVGTFAMFEGGLGVGWFWTDGTFDESIGGSNVEVQVEESSWLARIFVGFSL